ncbi:hypothetical protein HFO91_26665 [Rhizobium leguminosarum]|uniref:hypothetical protein n=1 Tax=Rhizobium leguminosarum TaxID=384 RepID=UPI001C94B2AE|nr:hypothetical protein [Rhizobium leguminosarum]MBY5365249.1 hypothetical protein [Rhizobium leguminosarum]MBY5453178.1 hypothetical protein [Rhizobium leguminosarum]
MKDYLPYAAGALAGLLVAFLLSSLLALTETPQLILFASLTAIGGALVERICRRRPNNS